LNQHKGWILVTGGCGFIGSHTVARLRQANYAVVVIDNLSSGKLANLAQWRQDPWVKIVIADISDGLIVPFARSQVAGDQLKGIIHLAAQVSVVSSLQNPLDDGRNNYQGTLQVLEFARFYQVPRVVMASSCAVYGDVTQLPVAESTATRPISPYGTNKLCGEHLFGCYQRVHGVSCMPLRFFNVYGPRQDPSNPYSGVISIFMQRCRDQQPLTIYGDGEQTRDFIYVADVADALAVALLERTELVEPLNLGTGVEITINQLAQQILQQAASQQAISHQRSRHGDIRRMVADTCQLHQQLQWRSQTDLATGLQATWQWFEQSNC